VLPILSLVIGLSAALAAREQIRHGDAIWRGAHLPGVALTVGAAVVPLGVYLFLIHPQWSTLYWCAPLQVSRWHLSWILPGAPLAGDLAAVFAFAVPVLLGAWAFLLVLFAIEGRKLHRASRARRETEPLESAVLVPPVGLEALAGPADSPQAGPAPADASGSAAAAADEPEPSAGDSAPHPEPAADGDEEP
jgi:hypothetical protein